MMRSRKMNMEKNGFMIRPIRLEFSNGLYHVMSRGNSGEVIFDEDEDRQQFLNLLAELIIHYEAICYAYCLMDNHEHLLLEAPRQIYLKYNVYYSTVNQLIRSFCKIQ
ncbi:transposase [Nitrosomonas sp. Nm33]|uniref:transposase n=1 Tax=Nitrosomonas sp. Nm33 TaxID=133724 RepID=UPI0008962DC3|nr:Transposase IS200 like [Nitrosomonas sp. Nm33]